MQAELSRPVPRSLRRSAATGWLWGALTAFVLLRIGALLVTDVHPTSDMAWYYGRAVGLIEEGRFAEGGVPTAFWPVGYPAFLAAMMGVFGTSVAVGQVANLMLSLVAAALVFRLAMRWFESPVVAVGAVGLLAVYPNHVGYTLGLYSEPLFTALLLGVCVLVTPGARPRALIGAGLLAGAATLVKAQMLLLAPLLIFVLLLPGWSWPALRRALGRTAIAAAAMATTIAPWTLRNQLQLGSPVPVSTNGGMSLLSGNNDAMGFDLKTDFVDSGTAFDRVAFSVADQVAADRRARAEAWRWIADHPARFVALMPKKLFRLWIPDGESEWALQAGWPEYENHRLAVRSLRWANQAYYFALLGLGLWGVYGAYRRHDPQTAVVPLLLAYFTALSLVFSGQSRYHAPLMPFLAVFASWALVHLFRRHDRAPVHDEGR